MTEFIDYLTRLGTLELIGVGGFVFYIFAFGAVQLGFLDGNSIAYTLANLAAATMVAVGLFAEFNLSSALIQGSWIVIGLAGFIIRTRKAWSNSRREQTSSFNAEMS